MLTIPTNITGPHQGAKLFTAGVDVAEAEAVVLLLHGRGATAASILELVPHFDLPHVAYLAPQASGFSWYPYSFLNPVEMNQPGLDSALCLIATILSDLQAQGVAEEKIFVGGFSQGACLTTEFVARYGRRLGGAFAFSGGLIGAEGTPRTYPGGLAGMPYFVGSSDVDSHIPLARVEETTAVLQSLGASVTQRIYPGMAHTINEDEVAFVQQMIGGG
jgi:glyoxalase family protein